MRRFLIEARPGAGKTTVARRVAELLRESGVPVRGFVTGELRQGRRRVGFEVEALGGPRATLAHVRLKGPPRVGRYGVDLEALERVALPALEPPGAETVVVIDELGKMELASERFRDAVAALFEARAGIVATVQLASHPLTDALKARDDVALVRLSAANREELPVTLARELERRG